MVNSVITHTYDLEKPLMVTVLENKLMAGDELGDRFDIAVTQKGRPADLSGASVTGYFIRTADGATVIVNGTAAGNTASVTLPESCYAVPGRFTLTIKVSLGGVRHAVYVGEGAVLRSSTDTIIDPGHEIPNLDELLAMISQVESAASAAQAAAQQATGAAGSANNAAGAANSAAAEANRAKGEADTAAANANAAAGTANQAASYLTNMDVEAQGLAAGDAPTAAVTNVDGHAHLTLGIPEGKQGIQGEVGPQGLQGIPGKIQSVWGVTSDDTGDAKPEIGGTNLLIGTKDFSGTWKFLARWTEDGTYLGFKVMKTVGEYYGISQTFLAKKGERYTFSGYAKENYADQKVLANVYIVENAENDNKIHNGHLVINDLENGVFKRVSLSFEALEDVNISPRIELAAHEGIEASLSVCGFKLERGNVPTDWSPAPEDKQDKIDMIGGRNYILNTEKPFHNSYVAAAEYDADISFDVANKEILKTLYNTTVTISFDYDFNIIDGDIDFSVHKTWQLVHNFNAKGVSKGHLSKTIYVNPMADDTGDLKYLYLVLHNFTGEITISKMKVERGDIPTDWSPAPEDVLNYAAFAGDPNAANAINDNKWFRFASLDTAIPYFNSNITFFMQTGMGHNDPGAQFGILTARVRTEEDFINDHSMYLKWLIVNVGVHPDDFKMTLRKTDHNSLLFELWVKHTEAFQTFQFTVLAEGTRADLSKNWKLYGNSFVGENLPEDALQTITSSVAPLLTAAAAAQEE